MRARAQIRNFLASGGIESTARVGRRRCPPTVLAEMVHLLEDGTLADSTPPASHDSPDPPEFILIWHEKESTMIGPVGPSTILASPGG